MSETTAPGGSATRKIKWLAIGIAVVIALYTGGWFFLASQVNRGVQTAIQQAEANGTAITCADQDVGGYPFRLGVRCDRTVIETPDGARVQAGAFRSAAQVYEPRRIISELDGPATIETPGVTASAEWDIARASTRLSDRGLEIGTLTLDNLRFETFPPSAATITGELDRAVASVRANGPDLDAAIAIDALDIAPVDGRDPPPIALDIDATVSDAASALQGGQPLESLRGRTVTLRNGGLALSGGGRIETSGTIAVDADGLASGEIEIGLSDATATVAALSSLFPEARGLIQTVGGVFGASGGGGNVLSNVLSGGATQTDADAAPEANDETDALRTITLSVRDGQIRAGFIPLGNVPPLP